MIAVRPAIPADAAKIAEINVITWKQAYKGLLPDDFLAARNLTGARIQGIAAWIARKDVIYLVAEQEGEIIGFLAGGIPRDENYPFLHEIQAIYVSPACQHKGVGQALFDEFRHRIGNSPFYLYALKGNVPAAAFYRKNGGIERPEYERPLPKLNLPTQEVLFAFGRHDDGIKSKGGT